VPAEGGLFQQYMAKGEDALRRGAFADAFDAFRIADDVSGRRVESLLGMVHARFAAGGSYAAASYYLQQALQALPELPLTPLKPEAMFAAPQTYRECLDRLARHVKLAKTDAPAQLVLAYFLWFDGKADQAEEALANALTARKAALGEKALEDDLLIEAVRIFRRGMAAGAKGSATSRPAETEGKRTGPPPATPAPKPGG